MNYILNTKKKVSKFFHIVFIGNVILFVSCNLKQSEFVVVNNDYNVKDISIEVDSFMIPHLMKFAVIAVTISNKSDKNYLFINNIQLRDTILQKNRFYLQTSQKKYSLSLNGKYLNCPPQSKEIYFFQAGAVGKESFSSITEIFSALKTEGMIIYESEGKLDSNFKKNDIFLDTIIIPRRLQYRYKDIKEVTDIYLPPPYSL